MKNSHMRIYIYAHARTYIRVHNIIYARARSCANITATTLKKKEVILPYKLVN